MSIATLEVVLRCAGALHAVQLLAMPLFWKRILAMGPDLSRLTPINREIVYVMAAAVVALLQGMGFIIVIGAEELARGPLHGCALVAFFALFWGARAVVQVVQYGARWPSGFAGRATHAGLSLLFSAKAGLYAAALLGMILR